MSQGNYTGAVHAFLKRLLPTYRFLLCGCFVASGKTQKVGTAPASILAMGGTPLFIAVGTVLKLPNYWSFLLFAVVGALVGFGIANFIEIRKI